MLKRTKVITSHSGHARFIAECDEDIAGYIPRQQDISSPYAYSPTHLVWSWNGTPIIIVETKHRRFEVFEVPAQMVRGNEDDAMRMTGFGTRI